MRQLSKYTQDQLSDVLHEVDTAPVERKSGNVMLKTMSADTLLDILRKVSRLQMKISRICRQLSSSCRTTCTVRTQ